MDIVAVDIGGTNARFARAVLIAGAAPVLDPPFRYDTAAYPDLAAAWSAFLRDSGMAPPQGAALALAGPVGGDTIALTNGNWRMRRDALAGALGVDRLVLLNDFGAMAHAVPWIDAAHSRHLAGPNDAAVGVTTVIGPGTGLGVAISLRRGGTHQVIETEGGHIAFAPLDAVEQRIADALAERHGRVSVERLVSGPGLVAIHEALGGAPAEAPALWAAAIDGGDPLAATALDRLVLAFGAVAGDLALAQGADAVLIVGTLANRIADRLASPAFLDRFAAKGRHEGLMRRIAIRLCTHPEPGLLGAAAAWQAAHPLP
ncbi:glucokinase [Sphingomonas flavalba]|uniref:glucokinase n=1 Tax=Sphingomonas flavalba TaxID=2559804 RepID=UPI00109E1BF2|nr:glucokinase [Sphingomonas flavalba]